MENYVVYEREIFIGKFIPFLKEMESLNKTNKYEKIRERIIELNRFIESIAFRSKKNLEKLRIRSTISKIENQIDFFFTRFFECFEDNEKSFEFLFDKINQLYRKRIYQINHLNGFVKIILSNLKEQPIFERYLFLNLFLDYHESFAVFLRPFILKLCKKEKSEFIAEEDITSNKIYRRHLPSFFKIEKPATFFRCDIRNIIAHNDYIIDPKDFSIEFYKGSIQKGPGKKMNVQPERQYKKLYNLVVWFTTEFDIRINEMMRKHSSSTFNHHWSRYFEEYVRSWKEYHKEDWNTSSVS